MTKEKLRIPHILFNDFPQPVLVSRYPRVELIESTLHCLRFFEAIDREKRWEERYGRSYC